MRTGFDPTTLTWNDVRDHFLPQRLQNDPGCVCVEFHARTPRLLKITARGGLAWCFRVENVALECADVTARECSVVCVAEPAGDGHHEYELSNGDELTLTAALLVIGLHGTLHEVPRIQRAHLRYKNAHWDNAAVTAAAGPPALLEIPPMPDFHPQLLPS
jgi:hypothetical protein